MFGETTIFHIKILNHPIERTVYEWISLVIFSVGKNVWLFSNRLHLGGHIIDVVVILKNCPTNGGTPYMVGKRDRPIGFPIPFWGKIFQVLNVFRGSNSK